MNVREFYDEDPRRRLSGEAAYGLRWRVADESALFGLHWIHDTREIYVMREPQPPMQWDPMTAALGPPPLIPKDEYAVEILGWADSEEILDEALDGWAAQMDQSDSLNWVRARLKDVEAATARKRAGEGDADRPSDATLSRRPVRP